MYQYFCDFVTDYERKKKKSPLQEMEMKNEVKNRLTKEVNTNLNKKWPLELNSSRTDISLAFTFKIDGLVSIFVCPS